MAYLQFHRNTLPRPSRFVKFPFGDIRQTVGHEGNGSFAKVNIIESEKGFDLALAAPGLDKRDFEIKLEKDRLWSS